MNLSRRTFLKSAGLVTLASASGCARFPKSSSRALVNDVHTKLNPTYVSGINRIKTFDELTKTIQTAKRGHRSVCIAGGRHAAGGQQFATDTELIDTRDLQRVLDFDRRVGIIEVETGIQWPELMGFLKVQNDQSPAWTIAQKQTGTDRLSIGGALAANAHGRGLRLPPFIANVESFVLVDTNGDCHTCSREQNPELFKLVIGGYGLFGFVYSAKLRLVPRRKVQRIVEMLNVEELPAMFTERIRTGFLHGDFQFAINPKSDDFLRSGILSCYRPMAEDTPVPPGQRALSEQDWKNLIYLAHTDPGRAFEIYAKHYLATSGQVYWSDTQYVSDYFEDYHRELDVRLKTRGAATEVIGELYVPREALPDFLSEARQDLLRYDVPMIYGTIRLIEQDNESFLAWAKKPYACVIFDLHTLHSSEGVAHTTAAFRRLIDIAIRLGGSYYLTYHRYATRKQVEACYPQFSEFLRLKRSYDPDERFQSNWYQHYKKMFA